MAAVVLLTGVAVSIARCGREKEINAQVMALKEEQTRQELRMQQEYGLRGAQKNLWAYGVHEYEYNRAILKRAQELKQETKEAKEEKQ